MNALRSRHNGFGMADVVFAMVILTTVIFGSMRLYADITRKKLDLMRSHEAESILLSLHEKERGRLFSYPLGPVSVLPVKNEERTYNISMTLKAVDGYPDDELREVKYEARYEIRGQEKERTVVRRVEQLD